MQQIFSALSFPQNIFNMFIKNRMCARSYWKFSHDWALRAPRGFQEAFERSIYIYKTRTVFTYPKTSSFCIYTRRGGNVLQPFCSSIYSYIYICGSLTCMIALILYVICIYGTVKDGKIHMNIKSTNFIFESKIYDVYIRHNTISRNLGHSLAHEKCLKFHIK